MEMLAFGKPTRPFSQIPNTQHRHLASSPSVPCATSSEGKIWWGGREGEGPPAHLHLLLVLGQAADVLLLLPVPLLEDGPLTLVQGNVLAWNAGRRCEGRGAEGAKARPNAAGRAQDSGRTNPQDSVQAQCTGPATWIVYAGPSFLPGKTDGDEPKGTGRGLVPKNISEFGGGVGLTGARASSSG